MRICDFHLKYSDISDSDNSVVGSPHDTAALQVAYLAFTTLPGITCLESHCVQYAIFFVALTY